MTNLLQRLREEARDRHQLLRRFGLRATIILLLIGALVIPSCELRGGKEELAVLVDLSSSVSMASVGSALTALDQSPPEHLLAFADRAVRASSVTGLKDLELLDRAASGARRAAAGPDVISRDHTNIGKALRSSLDLLDTDGSGRVLVLTDGNATDGSLDSAIAVANQRQVRIDTLPLQPSDQSPRIIGVDLPTAWTVDRAQSATVTIASSRPASMLLEVRVGEQATRRIAVDHPGSAIPRGLLSVPLDLRFSEPGDQPLSLRLVPTASDASASTSNPSRWRSTVRVGVRPRILLVEAAANTPLFRALSKRGLDLRSAKPSSLPNNPSGYQDLAAVLLNDIDANDMGTARMAALAAWVKSGGSLFFASGESSYGENGYNETPLAEVLPVTFEVREEKAEVALMISLDKSYSMKGEKMDLAKEATKAALGELEDEHLFGLVAFDWNTFNIVPLQPAANRVEIREQISKIEASAQTNFYPALESCFRQLKAIDDPTGRTVKHVILVSDGKTYPDDYEGLVRRMYDADITLSTVAVGLEADVELLQQIAQWGHGRSYFVQDAARVQKILLDEARSKLEDTLVEENTTVRARGSHPALSGIDFATAPPLLGYVSYREKPGTEVVLETLDGQPLLARRRTGSGETWLWASDLSDRWAASWLGWEGFLPMVSQILHNTSQGPFVGSQRFSVRRSGRTVELVASLLHSGGEKEGNGRPLNGAAVSVKLGGATTDSTRILQQVAPGEYRTTVYLDADPSGDMRFELIVDGHSVALRSVYYPGTDELQPQPIDAATLLHLAEATNGIAWPAGEFSQALTRRVQEVHRRIELWRWFLALAVLIYLIETILHRLGRLDRPFEETA